MKLLIAEDEKALNEIITKKLKHELTAALTAAKRLTGCYTQITILRCLT